MIRKIAFMIIAACIATAAAQEVNLIPDPELKTPSKWNLTREYKVLPGAGRENNNAIYGERRDNTEYTSCGITIPLDKLDKNTEYEFGAQVRTQPLDGETKAVGTLVVQFYSKGKWLSESWKHSPSNVNDWTLVSSSFYIPPQADRVYFSVLIPRNVTGRAWFSNFYVRPKTLTFLCGMLNPRQPQALAEGTHDFTLGCYTLSMPKEYNKATLYAEVEWKYGDAPAEKLVLPINNERIAFQRKDLRHGLHKLKVSLLGPDRKTVLAVSQPEIPVRVHEKIPERFVRIDERGRTWVDGKKFFPVGLYTNLDGVRKQGIKKTYSQVLDDITQSPFNCIMPYDSLGFMLSKQGGYTEVLDILHRSGKKMIFSFSYGSDPVERYRKVIAELKDHPALLAWYIADEVIPEKRLWLMERNELINSLDPWHPTWAVFGLYDKGSLSRYAGSCNVFGIDPYPINNAQTAEISSLREKYVQTANIIATEAGMALWSVPQWFSWALYRDKANEIKHLYRWPTEAEALTQALIGAIGGAKGFVFYSYFDMLREKNCAELWAQICRVGEALNEFGPYLLGDNPGPKLDFKEKTASVRTGSFMADNGKTAIVITCDGSVPGRAEFTVRGKLKLTSKYGLARQNDAGGWVFESTGINSDILYQE